MALQDNGYQVTDELVDSLPLPIQMKRSEVRFVKAVKFSEPELQTISKFQEWLATTRNPQTGGQFIPRNEFSSFIHFCINFTFTQMRAVAEELARAEEAL